MEKRLILFVLFAYSHLFSSAKTDECFFFIDQRIDYAAAQLEKFALQEGAKKIEEGLYIKILKNGVGSVEVCQNDIPEVVFTAKEIVLNGDGPSPYKTEHPIKIDIAYSVPGIQRGMEGMKEKEVRRIFFHPSLGQGVFGGFWLEEPFYVDIEIIAINRSESL